MSATNEHLLHPLGELPGAVSAHAHFLPSGATPAQLIQAAAINHTEWFAAKALADGGEVRRTDGVTWTVSPKQATIAFPRLKKAHASRTLDSIVAECYARKLTSISCMSLSPTSPRDLGGRISARGFEWGWRPHWMALDLHNLRADFPLPEGLHIAVDEESDWDVEELPYYQREDAAFLRALSQADPRRMWHFGAWLDGKIVGHSILYLTTGSLGVGGIYNVGVCPSARHRGIGRAVSLAACQFAQALGAHHALLNSAADSLYKGIGFQSLGYGQTWWMHAATLAAPPPTPAQIAFVEAIGTGDIAALDTLGEAALPADLDTPTASGMTLMDLAVRARKPASAEWLAAHGATLNVLHAWDLGWKVRARRLLAESPSLANRRSGPLQTTPLHEAAARGDVRLARLLLTADPDLAIQDSEYHSTPLGWATFFQNAEIVRLIERHQKSRKPANHPTR